MNNDNKGNLAAETRREKKKPLVPLLNFSLIKFLQGMYLWVAGWWGHPMHAMCARCWRARAHRSTPLQRNAGPNAPALPRDAGE